MVVRDPFIEDESQSKQEVSQLVSEGYDTSIHLDLSKAHNRSILKSRTAAASEI